MLRIIPVRRLQRLLCRARCCRLATGLLCALVASSLLLLIARSARNSARSKQPMLDESTQISNKASRPSSSNYWHNSLDRIGNFKAKASMETSSATAQWLSRITIDSQTKVTATAAARTPDRAIVRRQVDLKPLNKCWEVKAEQHDQATWDQVCHRPSKRAGGLCLVKRLDAFPKLASEQSASLESLALKMRTYSSEDEASRRFLADSDWGNEAVETVLELLGGKDETDQAHWLLDVGSGLGVFTLATVARGRWAAAVEANHHSLARLAASLGGAAAVGGADPGEVKRSARTASRITAKLFWNALESEPLTANGSSSSSSTGGSESGRRMLAYKVSSNACVHQSRPHLINVPLHGGRTMDWHPVVNRQAPSKNKHSEETDKDDEEVDKVRVSAVRLDDILSAEPWPAPRLLVKWDMAFADLDCLRLAACGALAWPNVTGVLLLEVPAESAGATARLMADQLHFKPHRLLAASAAAAPADEPGALLDLTEVETWPNDILWLRAP